MSMERKVRIASFILFVVAITFAGMAAVHFFAGGPPETAYPYAQGLAIISIAFGVLTIAVPVAFRPS